MGTGKIRMGASVGIYFVSMFLLGELAPEAINCGLNNNCP